MSITPRTDDQIGYDGSTMSAIRIDFCRQLERELNAANVEIEEKRKDVVWLATEKAKSENYVTELENRLRALWDKYDGDRKHYMDRIKRLEDAGDYLCAAAAFMGWHDKIEAWNKAKESQ